MRWSISELIYAWKIHRSLNWRRWIIELPKRWYRRTKLVFFWLFRGFTYEATWDLDSYFMEVIIDRLKIFKKMRSYGYPAIFDSEEEWVAILDKMIKGFEVMKSEEYSSDYPEIKSEPIISPVQIGEVTGISYDSNMTEEERKSVLDAMQRQADNDRETLELFAKYFKNLWD